MLVYEEHLMACYHTVNQKISYKFLLKTHVLRIIGDYSWIEMRHLITHLLTRPRQVVMSLYDTIHMLLFALCVYNGFINR